MYIFIYDIFLLYIYIYIYRPLSDVLTINILLNQFLVKYLILSYAGSFFCLNCTILGLQALFLNLWNYKCDDTHGHFNQTKLKNKK